MEGSPQNKTPYELALEKSRSLGFFALTAADHSALHSTPSEELVKNSGKPAYEVMTAREIEELIDNAFACLNDMDFIRNGYADTQRKFLILGIPYLKSVGYLPEKYKDFDVSILK